MAVEIASQSDGTAAEACPHIVFGDVLGQSTVAELLLYVAARQADFEPAVVRNRESHKLRVDYGLRSSVSLTDLGPFKAPLKTFVRDMATSALARFRLTEPAGEPKDFEITAFRDGNRFGAHIDTDERVARVRVLSCVYYFAVTPRRFSGGELQLYGFPTLSAAKRGSPAFVDVIPETDTMVVFPSWLRHEVLPVRVPSGVWLDSRFTVNCWLHRVS